MKKIITYVTGIIAFSLMIFLCTDSAKAKDSAGNIVVIVDAGHGGRDSGAASSYDKESVLNWNIAVALKSELQTYNGIKVYLTRGSAEWNTNAARGRFGSSLGADLVVSVHNNSGGDGSANGVSVYGTVNATYKAEIKKLSELICKKVSALGLKNLGYHARVSTKDSTRDYYTLIDEGIKCNIPGLIIEHCYLNNKSDAAFIHSAENQIKCGIADATAIAEYYGLSKRGSVAGSEIELLRTYSTHMITNLSGEFKSSDTSVAVVDANGLVTAVGAGKAVISCTGTGGEKESFTVNVPAVKMIGLAAGINPTFYNAGDVANYDKNKVIVKAIYSDGHAEQIDVSKVTFGEITESSGKIYDVALSYNGLSCKLRIYGTGAAGSYQLSNNDVMGTNVDILSIPQIYNGINTGIKIVADNGSVSAGVDVITPPETKPETPTEPITEAATEPETEPVTEPVTEQETEAQTETEAETETEKETETSVIEQENYSTSADKDNEEKNSTTKTVYIIIALVLAVLITAGLVFYIIMRNKKKGFDR